MISLARPAAIVHCGELDDRFTGLTTTCTSLGSGRRMIANPPGRHKSPGTLLCMSMSYDSTPDTLWHSLRVAELMGELIKELLDRSIRHDLSKTREPERAVYDEVVPQLRAAPYGSVEYRTLVDAMGEGLRHHYAHNRHHPEHFADGINGMTLVDLVEMLADWQAATERTARGDGDLAESLTINRERFGIAPQLMDILTNTAHHFGWLAAEPDRTGVAAEIDKCV